jgi:hypothetical protein
MSPSVPPEPYNIQRIYTSAGDYSPRDIEAKKAANLSSLKNISRLANGNFKEISQALSGQFDIQIQQEGTGFKLLYGPSHPDKTEGEEIAIITNVSGHEALIDELRAIWASIYPPTVGISGKAATHGAPLIDAPSAARSVAHRALAANPGGDSPSLARRVVDLSAVNEGKKADGLLINHFRTHRYTDLDQAAWERLYELFSDGQLFSQTDPQTPLFDQAALEFISANDLYLDQYEMMTLDVYLLQDIIYSLDHGKFKEAAFSMSLLSPVDKQILSDRLDLSITSANFTHDQDDNLKGVALSLSTRSLPPQTVLKQFQQTKIRDFQTSISEERLRQALDEFSELEQRSRYETDRLRADLEASSRENTELLGALEELSAQVPILASELEGVTASAERESARAQALT